MPPGGPLQPDLCGEQMMPSADTAEHSSTANVEKLLIHFHPARMSASVEASTFPPDRIITVRPGGVPPCRYAANATAPLGSLTRWACSASSRTAARISFSDTV